MKEGSFAGEIPDLDFAIQHDVRKVKTPDQIPDRIDLSQVPEGVLRSSVIESLIQQNDDLMARLNVNLRRVGMLEDKLNDSQNEAAQMHARYDNVKDQVLVLREQSRMLADRARAMEQQREAHAYNDHKEQAQILEIRYAELFTTSQEKQAKLEKRVTMFERVLRTYKKYRQNIRHVYVTLHAELKMLREKRAQQDEVIHDLRHNLTETTSYITTQAKDFKTQTSTLTAAYETELKAHRGEVEMLVEQNRVLGERMSDYERLQNDKIKLENDLIIAERREESYQLRSAAEIVDLQKALARHRNDNAAIALDLESRIKELAEKSATLIDANESARRLTEQVETLQLLWRDQQNQIEKINEQRNALQKLNQELSITINEYRREMREIKGQLEAAEQKNFDLKNTEERTREAMIAANAATDAAKNEVAVLREDTVTPEIISKIDKVLNSLHVGS